MTQESMDRQGRLKRKSAQKVAAETAQFLADFFRHFRPELFYPSFRAFIAETTLLWIST